MESPHQRVSTLSLAGVWCGIVACAMTTGSARPEPSARATAAPVPHASLPSVLPAEVLPKPAPRQAAPVFQDTDSLAFRELVALPTEHVDAEAKARAQPAQVQRIKLLGFNDFHGHLGTAKMLEGRSLGGAAVLASYFRAHTRGFEGRSVIAHAGDFVGASPAPSALFQDEPSIAFFAALSNQKCDRDGHNPKCNLVGILGNHEFDEGVPELLRLLRGGNHANGPFLGKKYRGASFPVICANVVDSRSGKTILPPHVVKDVSGIKVGFVGAVLAGASWFLVKSGIASVRFEDEVTSINRSVAELKNQGVRAIVVIVHQGGHQRFSRDLPRDENSVSGEVKRTVGELDGEVDVVIAGHSHSVLSAILPNRDRRPTLLTQAFHSSTAFADIDLDVDAASGQVVAKRGRIVSTFGDTGPGLTPDEGIKKLVIEAEQSAEKRTRVVVGHASALISSDANADGESPLGDLVADAQRSVLRSDLAFTSPAWLRADIRSGPITWGDLFTIQPFGNRLMRVELSGREVLALLNQQWVVESYSRILHLSGLSYTWDARRPAGDRVTEVLVGGRPIVPDKR